MSTSTECKLMASPFPVSPGDHQDRVAPLVSISTEYYPWASLFPGSPDEHQYGVQAHG